MMNICDFFSPEPVVQEMLFINVSIFSSGGHCAHWAELFTRFLWRALWGTFRRNYFQLGPVVQGEMSFKRKVYT